MFAATLFCLGVAISIFVGLVCYWLATFSKSARTETTTGETVAWNNIKTALIGLYSQYEKKETSKQRALRSWAGTMVICAGICMIGVLLEAKYNQLITVETIVAGFVPRQHVSEQACLPKTYWKSSRSSTSPKTWPKANTQNKVVK